MKFAHPLQLIRNKFFKDTLVLQISGMITVTTSFVSSASIAFLLGAHGMGLFAVAVTLQAAFYSLAHVGVVSATVSQLAAASARELHEKVTLWLAFFVKVYLLFSSVMIAAGFFAMPALSRWWYGEDLGLEEAQRLGIWAWWLTWWILIDTPRAMAQVAARAHQIVRHLLQQIALLPVQRQLVRQPAQRTARAPAAEAARPAPAPAAAPMVMAVAPVVSPATPAPSAHPPGDPPHDEQHPDSDEHSLEDHVRCLLISKLRAARENPMWLA